MRKNQLKILSMIILLLGMICFFEGCGSLDYIADYPAAAQLRNAELSASGAPASQIGTPAELVHQIRTKTGQGIAFTSSQALDALLGLLSIFGGSAMLAASPVIRRIAKPILPVIDRLAFNVKGAKNATA